MQNQHNANDPALRAEMRKRQRRVLKQDVILSVYSTRVINREHIQSLDTLQGCISNWNALIDHLVYLLSLEMAAERRTITNPEEIEDLVLLYGFLRQVNPSTIRTIP